MRGSIETVYVLAAGAVTLLCSSSVNAGGTGGTMCPQPGGPDLICADIQSSVNYTAEQVAGVWVDAFSFGHYMCNVGDTDMVSQAFPSNQHEAVIQNLYRLKNGRIEQIGMGWLMHGFMALTDNFCGCGCNGHGNQVLGVGCSNPYTGNSSGLQAGLTPRWQVNAHTSYFPTGGGANPSFSGTTMRRLRVKSADLEPSSASVLYFAERQYVTPTEASGTQNNNGSYRSVAITGGTDNFAASVIGSTVREQSAIRAWKASDPAVVETDIQLPGEGLFILAAKATQVSGNEWNYEFALFNMNSDLSCQAFRVPLPSGAVVTNIGFHDVDYHSGDAVDNFTDPNLNFSGQDWQVTITPNSIEWASETYAQNINANALRWGTMYNFRFNINRAPENVNITLTTYKVVGAVEAATVVPAPSPCPADLTPAGQPDGTIGVSDLLALINQWGPCVPGSCAADITGDGSVGAADLLALINAWGPCS